MKKETVKDEMNYLKRNIKNIDDRLSRLPDDRVSVICRRGSYSLSAKTGGKKTGSELIKKYVSVKNPEAGAYATEYYLLKLKKILENDLSALQTFDKKYKYDERYKLVKNIPGEIAGIVKDPLITKDDYIIAWANEKYDSNPMPFDERFCYMTTKGERVRSRAEVIIAEILSSLSIPYRYEAPLWTGVRTVYPDFTIINPETGEEFYIEYFGMMNDPGYAADQFSKIREYDLSEKAGQFIYIFEHGDSVSMNVEAIKNLLVKRMGRTKTNYDLFS